MKKLFIIVVIALTFGVHLRARGGSVYYIATTGDDTTGNGSIGTPWLTLSKAASVMAAGDTCYLRGGTYTCYLSYVWHTIPSGTSGSHVTFAAYAAETPIIQQTYNYGICLGIDDDYIDFTGITFDGTSVNYAAIEGAAGIITSGSNVTITNCTFLDYNTADSHGDGAMGVVGDGDYISIINCTMHDIGARTSGAQGHCVYTQGDNWLIDGGEYYNSAYSGIEIGPGTAAIVRNAYLHDNAQAGIISYSHTNALIYNNVTEGNSQSGIELYSSVDGFGVYNNTLYDEACGIRIANADCDSNVLRNNLLRNTAAEIADSGTGTVTSNNFLDTADPLFTNAAIHDFTLTAPSPCWDAGADLSAVFTTDKAGRTRTVPFSQGAYQNELIPPTLSTPANGSTGQVIGLSLTWTDTNTTPNESHYYVRIKKSGGAYQYYETSADATSVVASTAFGGALSYNTSYYWSVQALGDAFEDSAFASDYSFGTENGPPTGEIGYGSRIRVKRSGGPGPSCDSRRRQ